MGIWTPGLGRTGGDGVFLGNASSEAIPGGAGDDTFDRQCTCVVDRPSEVVSELATDGADTVQTSIRYALGSNLMLIGALATNGARPGNVPTRSNRQYWRD